MTNSAQFWEQYKNVGMTMGLTEQVAVVQSKRICGQGDCDGVATYDNGTCIALVSPSEKDAPAAVCFGKSGDDAPPKAKP